MELTPFSLEDAEEICEDFEDLKDTEFTLEGTPYIVEDVLVCPFGAEAKDELLAAFSRDRAVFDAGAWRSGTDFDVTLIVSNLLADDGFSLMGIRHYAAEKGVNYNFP